MVLIVLRIANFETNEWHGYDTNNERVIGLEACDTLRRNNYIRISDFDFNKKTT